MLQAVVSVKGARIDQRLGSMTFDQLYRELSAEYKYAVVLVGQEFWLIDMYHPTLYPPEQITKPDFACVGDYSVHPTLDAAICAAVFNY